MNTSINTANGINVPLPPLELIVVFLEQNLDIPLAEAFTMITWTIFILVHFSWKNLIKYKGV